ncbi:CynX/NimT family MFS transporter [Streptomyces prunicolor]|uniref:CynX/NimT family MFS transporter n=1 Tax=Streptomyces prunicolor TaxID=67348 RepID=UPI0037D3C99F
MALSSHPTGTGRSWVVIVAAGVAAGLQVWKVPPALPFLRHELSLSLVQAGTLLGIVQLAGMLGGLAVSLLAELIGERRCLSAGLVLLFVGSAGGGFAWSAAPLLASRAVEGAGFILVAVTGPGLIRRTAPPGRFTTAMGFWGAYQGISTFAGLVIGALVLQVMPWRVWWWGMAVVALLPLPWVLARVPRDDAGGVRGAANALARIGRTVRAPGPWTAGLVFACYTLPWMAVVGFLPTIYRDGGMIGSWPGVLSALVGAANAVGSIATAALMQRGLPTRVLLVPAFVLMAVTSVLAFAVDWHRLPAGTAGQFACVAVFSLTGGAIPATLLRMIGELTPAGGSAPATMGLIQQLFNAGSVIGPTLAAWLATRTGDWHSTWWITCACAAVGIVLGLRLGDRSGTATATSLPQAAVGVRCGGDRRRAGRVRRSG